MDVPFRLTRRERPATTDGLFVASVAVADLLAVVRALPGGWPHIFRAAGGFVVVLRGPVPSSIPLTIRLRRLAGDLYLPADADLLPALLPDEAVSLTRDRGLVFLPGGTVLAFDPARPLREADVLSAGPIRRGEWQPFPERPTFADRLHTIRGATPPTVAFEILTAGEPDDREPLGSEPGAGVPEDARPPSGSLAGRASAGAKLGAGQFLNWLGRALGAKRLAEAGAKLARKAVEQVPRLSEKVLGAQEAALRELLRQLQSGDAERALRRAPAAVAEPGSSGRIDGGSRLADHGTGYSLRDLLGSGAGGGATWLGGVNVWDQLAAEYRRLAEEAVRRGDYRRAAYIWGVLLRNVRQAAHVLDAGGLHRDAAILYRDKVVDVPAAARCLERAGCWDEAVVLYQQLQEYEKAGDVFRRIGDEDAALAMYTRAAERLAERGRHAAAGDLMRDKAGLPGRAASFYAVGWEAGSDTLACGLRLLDYRVYAEAWAGVRELVAGAEERFVPPRADDAGRFFAAVVRHTAHVMPDELRAELKDRARLALAGHLRHHARTSRHQGSVVSQLFGGHDVWPGPVVRDAREALKRALGPAPTAEPAGPVPFRLLDGPVTAAAVARLSFDLILGNEAGAVVMLTGREGRIIPVRTGGHPTAALAVSPDGRHIAALSQGATVWLESIIDTGGGYESRGGTHVGDFPDKLPYLQPEIETDGPTHVIWLRGPDADRKYTGPAVLTWTGQYSFSFGEGDFESPIFCAPEPPGHWDWWGALLALTSRAPDSGPDDEVRGSGGVPWRPAVPAGSAFEFPPLDWLRPRPRVLELVGVAEDGAVYWSEFREEGRALAVSTATRSVPAGYRAACLTGPGLLAAVTAENELHWLRADGSPVLRPWGTPRRLDHLAAAVFAAHRPAAGEVAVVFADGWAVRVPKP